MTVVLAAGALALVPEAGAVTNTCQARNLTQGTPSGPDLQAEIDAASPGDTIQVKRICVGNFTIAKDLHLVGASTKASPKPVLDGNDAGPVLSVEDVAAEVTLTNLMITGGIGSTSTPFLEGGGIVNEGTVTLERTVVRGNSAEFGGGVSNVGMLIMNGSSSVRGNVASFWGGGIDNGGTVLMNGSSSVRGNRALELCSGCGQGGGIIGGTVILNESATVSGNMARGAGGGIASATVTLNESATVSGNTGRRGGGIHSSGAVTLNDSSSVQGNLSRENGGGILSVRGTVTLNGSASVTGNRADFNGGALGGDGGGIFMCGGVLNGAVDGGNVNDNYVGSTGTTESNIVIACS